jgi:hypothetical protein
LPQPKSLRAYCCARLNGVGKCWDPIIAARPWSRSGADLGLPVRPLSSALRHCNPVCRSPTNAINLALVSSGRRRLFLQSISSRHPASCPSRRYRSRLASFCRVRAFFPTSRN